MHDEPEPWISCDASGCTEGDIILATTPTGPSLDRSWAATVAALRGRIGSATVKVLVDGYGNRSVSLPEEEWVGIESAAALTAEPAGGVA